jgi:hypothetical protein
MERIDAAGRTLRQVFQDKKKIIKMESFKLWLINLDIWGSVTPLNVQCYDI